MRHSVFHSVHGATLFRQYGQGAWISAHIYVLPSELRAARPQVGNPSRNGRRARARSGDAVVVPVLDGLGGLPCFRLPSVLRHRANELPPARASAAPVEFADEGARPVARDPADEETVVIGGPVFLVLIGSRQAPFIFLGPRRRVRHRWYMGVPIPSVKPAPAITDPRQTGIARTDRQRCAQRLAGCERRSEGKPPSCASRPPSSSC